MTKRRMTGGIFVFVVFISVSLVFSQAQENVTSPAPEVAAEPAVAEPIPAEPVPNEPEVQWIWGEVLSVDMQNKALLVKYVDYEVDQEKEITFSLDDKTKLENVAALDEIKAKDSVSVDYIVTADGSNLAKSISVEKAEDTIITEEDVANITEEQSVPPMMPPAEQSGAGPAR